MADDLFDGEGDRELPSARGVNRQMRAEAKAAKAATKRARKGEGALAGLLRRAQHQHPGDPRKQLSAVLSRRELIPAAIGRERPISIKSFNDLRVYMHQFLSLLPQLRCPIKNLGDLGRSHFLALTRFWESEGIAESSVIQYHSKLRRFLTLIGKPDAIPTKQELQKLLTSHGIVAGTLGRTYVPRLSRAWCVHGVDAAVVIAGIRADGEEVVACQLEMEWRFGLRDEEAFSLIPEDSDAGDRLVVSRGTKGGKPRVVKYFRDPEKARLQREALERAKRAAAAHPQGILAIPGLTKDQMRSHFTEVVKKHAITKKASGVTPHGLRHEFGVELFLDVTGMPAPILKLLPASEYKRHAKLVREGMLEVARQMGHERTSISVPYVGSVGALSKEQENRIRGYLDDLDAVGPALAQAGAAEAWMIGTAGRGAMLVPGEAMEVAVQLHGDMDAMPMREVAERLERLRLAAEAAMVRRVAVIPWMQPAAPADGTEILFAFGVQRQAPARASTNHGDQVEAR